MTLKQQNDDEYDLLITKDSNSNGNSQWFFFSVKNMQKHTTVRFNIMNMGKASSLHNTGMRILVRSRKDGKKWQRGCDNISWIENIYFRVRVFLTIILNYLRAKMTMMIGISSPYPFNIHFVTMMIKSNLLIVTPIHTQNWSTS